jgi:hypothetical protein
VGFGLVFLYKLAKMALVTTYGRVWFLLLTTDGRVGNPFKFCFIYGTLPYLTAFIGCIGSFDGPCHLFDSFLTVLRMTLSPLFFNFL